MKSTTNLGFATYLKWIKGREIADYKKNDSGFVTFFFEMGPEEWKKLKIEYNNSESLRFKSGMENMRNLIE